MHGYSPEDEKIIWTKPIPKSKWGVVTDSESDVVNFLLGGSDDERRFKPIPDTPFIIKFFDNQLYVINSYTGDMLFEPQKENTFYFQAEYLFEEDAFLIRGLEKGQLVILKYDLKTKRDVWKTIVSKGFSGFLKLISKDKIINDRMEIRGDHVFILEKTKFYVLNKDTGELLWSLEDGDYDNFYTSFNGEQVLLSDSKGLLGIKEKIDFRRGATGEKVWKKPITTKYLVLFQDWEDKMMLAHYSGFNFYDYKTGNKLWKKAPKGKSIKTVLPIDSDFLYLYDNEMMLVDKKGQKKWKNDIKICDNPDDPVLFLEKTKNNKVLYVTATFANLVDYDTGKKVWKGNLKLNEKRPTIAKFNKNTNEFIIFNDEELYRFKEDMTQKPKPYAKLKLKNEKLISSMDLFSNTLSISGQSEVVGVDNSGNVIFHNKYVQPGEFARKLGKNVLGVVKVGAAISTAEATVSVTYRDSEGNSITDTSEPIAVFGEKTKTLGEAGYLTSGISQSLIAQRFNAMQETDEYAIIFAKGENAERLLIRVDKETGEEVDKIIVQNTKPMYDYDAATKSLFYSHQNKVYIFKEDKK